MKTLIIKMGIVFVNIIYFFVKFLPTNKKKITFISRQNNNVSIDFKMTEKELKAQKPEIKTVILCKTLEEGFFNKIKYCLHMLRQMYHIATSKVVILDSYCILICILKHKKSLKIIQYWHALGSLKKFGYSSLDKRDGRSSDIAKAMKMHKNYTYILTSSKVSKPFFREAFNAKEEQMKVMSLPRVDFLQSKDYEKQIQDEFYKIYSEANNQKENILYCPTQRKDEEIDIVSIIKAANLDKFNLIIKLHNGQEYVYTKKEKVSRKSTFTGLELLHIADYVITDYSAIVHEAAIANKPIYLYTFDYDKYVNDRGWYINYKEEMPGIIESDITKIMKKIESKEYNQQKINEFKTKYVDDLSKNVTRSLVEFILDNID